MSRKKMLTFFVEINPRLVSWGSDSVLRAFAHLRYTSTENTNPNTILKNFINLLVVIRKDLGHKSKDMEEDLVKIFLNDDPKKVLEQ